MALNIFAKHDDAPLNAMGAPATGTDLVLEGGGLRGMFTAGVMDVLMEQGIYGFDNVWGVSAGAINAASYLSHQQGRFMRQVLAFRDDDRFMSVKSLAKTGDLTGGEFLYYEVQNEIDPFDYETYAARRSRFFAVATDVVFGTPAYLEVKSLPEDVEMVHASASLAVLSPIVEIGGGRYMDGGTADSVPVEKALEEGAERALVVLTRDRGYEKTGAYELQTLADVRYADYPYYLEALRNRAERYNEQRERIWELEREGKIVVIAPEEPVNISTLTGVTGEALLSLYLEGRRLANENLGAIRSLGV